MKRVVKFGGSNLKTKADISRIIRAVRSYNEPLVIVVSALFGITAKLIKGIEVVSRYSSAIAEIREHLWKEHESIINEYIEDESVKLAVCAELDERIDSLCKYLTGINCLGESPDFARDMILSFGERFSSLILSAVLEYSGFDCVEILPEDLGLVTDGRFRNATVDIEKSAGRVRKSVGRAGIVVVPGFYGVSEEGKVNLLGRGGSDYSAAAIASCINSESVDVWKDVKGFMTADPKITDNPVPVRSLTYTEAAELSYFGARIIHPRTFEPVKTARIPVRVFNICSVDEKPEPISVINCKTKVVENVVKSVTFTDDISILKLKGPGVGIIGGIISEASSVFEDLDINIKSIITSQTSINLLLSDTDIKRAATALEEAELRGVREIEVLSKISLIAVVGEGMLNTPGIASKVLRALSGEDINILMMSAGASEVAAYFIVEENSLHRGVKAIHREFFK